MTESRNGQVVTFYSYSGGTGRTMALANIAWILASEGKRVLAADWTLEAPGLHPYFAPFLAESRLNSQSQPGVIDMVRGYEEYVGDRGDRSGDWQQRLVSLERYVIEINQEFPNGGALHLLLAGRQNPQYASTIGALDWEFFYENLGGAEFLDALRDNFKASYDFTLIDCSSGLSDIADICTLHLPDTLVNCFKFKNNSINGAAQVANAVSVMSKRRAGASAPVRILPVAMLVDGGANGKIQKNREHAYENFLGLLTGMSSEEKVKYFRGVEIPYTPQYEHEETLAAFVDSPSSNPALLTAYARLAAYISGDEIRLLDALAEAATAGNSGISSLDSSQMEEQYLMRAVSAERSNRTPLVFLCHSSGDKDEVRRLYRRLKADGILCWFDEQELLAGQDFDRVIRKAIRASRYVVACLSSASTTKSGYVQKELKSALDLADEQPEGTIFLIPARLEECETPERLQRLHRVDLFKDGGYELLLRSRRPIPETDP